MDSNLSLTGTWGEEKKRQFQSPSEGDNMYTTTLRSSYNTKGMEKQREKDGNKFAKFMSEQSNSTVNIKLNRSQSKLLRESDAPIAVGRSGMRQEKGISASGLLGERLMTSNDPKENSFAQRSWLYADEKSIYYRKNDNVPTANIPADMCLPIGGDLSNEPFLGWAYGRKAVLTGDILTKSGSCQAGVFLDDKYFV